MSIHTEPTPPRHPGQMTAVMRAAAQPQGSRVLRAAVVRGGKVIEERVLPPGTHLTVGPSERSTFVIASSHLAPSTRLIEWSGAGYRLLALPGMIGRAATEAGIFELDARSGKEPLVLGQNARGKIVLGDTMILFHFVAPPVRPPRAQLPIAVRQGPLDELDWRTTFIAAFSFLVHFGALGALYSDFADGVVDDEARVLLTVDSFKDLPHPPIEVAQTAPDASSGPAEKPAPTPPGGVVAPPHGGGPGPARPGPSGGGRMAESRAHDIAAALDAMDGAMVVAIGGHNNSAVGRVLAIGEQVPIGMLNGVAAQAGGVQTGGVAGLNMHGDGGGVLAPGALGRGGLPGGDTRADAKNGDVGKSIDVKKPVATAQVSPPVVTGDPVPDAPGVIAGLRGALRNCYKRTLDDDPTARGSVRVTLSIAPNGEVHSAQAAASGLPSGMVSCVKRVVGGAQFNPPQGGGATLVVPMSFFPQ